MKLTIPVLLILWLISAARCEVTDPVDQQILKAFLEHVDKSEARSTPERMARFAAQPEDIVWQASHYVRMPLVAYRLTGNQEYLEDPERWKHWIGAEHRSGYYSLSVSQAVLLYEHGLLFDRADIDRFLKTQIAVCWNGDQEDPRWARVDGRRADSRYLCTWLAPFDERIYEMALGAAARQERLDNKTHPWQGGVVACTWLEMKYLVCPLWSDGTPSETATTGKFLSQPKNQSLLTELAFQVGVPGYQPPESPAEMKQPSRAQ